ncbi:MAG: TIGR04211 family SH3 domain-containing protein [Magnetococcales bacterium]|nr:TIGR04211 family SH3 domain-containing protein [Magnetococcales bacterium]
MRCSGDGFGFSVRLLMVLFCLLMTVSTLHAEESNNAAAAEGVTSEKGPAPSLGRRYVSDNFSITMRRGNARHYKVVKVIRTGESLDLLEEHSNGWNRVRIRKSGLEGWVLKRFLSAERPAKTKLDAAIGARIKAESARDRLRHEVSELKKRLRNQDALEKELARVKKISSNALTLAEENKVLRANLARSHEELTAVTDEKRLLKKRSDTHFFLAGAGVLILGLIVGGILARRGRQSGYGGLM